MASFRVSFTARNAPPPGRRELAITTNDMMRVPSFWAEIGCPCLPALVVWQKRVWSTRLDGRLGYRLIGPWLPKYRAASAQARSADLWLDPLPSINLPM